MKVITFSRNFPATHPRKGQPTHFVEKIWLWGYNEDGWSEPEYFPEYKDTVDVLQVLRQDAPKYHTIRGGNRWKAGDEFSPRIWSGKPYSSKQIEFGPSIKIKKVWSFDIARGYMFIDRKCYGKFHPFNRALHQLATNDGLTAIEMIQWFNIHPKAVNLRFSGQILCWNEALDYSRLLNS